MTDEIGPTLKKGHEFIKESQVCVLTLTRIYLGFSWSICFILLEILKVKDNPSGDFKSMYRHISKGSWTFSDQDHGWQVSDCTAEGLKVTFSVQTLNWVRACRWTKVTWFLTEVPSVTVLSPLFNDGTRNCWYDDGTRTTIWFCQHPAFLTGENHLPWAISMVVPITKQVITS